MVASTKLYYTPKPQIMGNRRLCTLSPGWFERGPHNGTRLSRRRMQCNHPHKQPTPQTKDTRIRRAVGGRLQPTWPRAAFLTGETGVQPGAGCGIIIP